MPRLDGTGPRGQGAGTGRGFGPCGGGAGQGVGRRGGSGFGFGRSLSPRNKPAMLEDKEKALEKELVAIKAEKAAAENR